MEGECFDIDVRVEPALVVVTLHGEFDMVGAQAIDDRRAQIVEAAGLAPVVFGTAGVTFADASAVAAVMRLARELPLGVRQLRFREVPAALARVLGACGLLEILAPSASRREIGGRSPVPLRRQHLAGA